MCEQNSPAQAGEFVPRMPGRSFQVEALSLPAAVLPGFFLPALRRIVGKHMKNAALA